MNRHRFLVALPRLFLIAALTLLAGACDRAPPAGEGAAPAATPGAAPEPTPGRRVALVMKTLTNPFFVEMEKGARQAEREFGISLIVKTAAQETSIQQQIAIVEELVRERVDAIVIAPGDSVELIPVLKRAQEEGIVVINIDNRLDPDFSRKNELLGVPFISVDNEQSAYRSARYIAVQVSESATALLMEGIRGALNAEARKNGAMRAFAEQHPAITLGVSETANWKIDEGCRLMRRWLQRHPDVRLVFAANDMMAFGIINALQEAGREDVLVASFDALEQAREAIREGRLQVTVDQRPARQGYLGVQFALRALDGETLPGVTYLEAILVTRENVDQP
ncbi:MAG: sugar ABC transporter substrate-binding protein [gamma proteobacterium symbiont of Phacoides pectinatus]